MNRKTSPEREKAVMLCRKAKRYLEEKKFQKSSALVRKALTIDREYYYAHFLMAILIKDDHLQEAIGHLRKAVAYEPRYQQAWCELGIALARSMDTLDEGLVAFEKAYHLDPSEVWTVIVLASRSTLAVRR